MSTVTKTETPKVSRNPKTAPAAFIGPRPKTGGRVFVASEDGSRTVYAYRIERSGARVGFVAYGSRKTLEKASAVADRRSEKLAKIEGRDVTFRVLLPSGKVAYVATAVAPKA
jgi:hypothetical protein